MNWSGLHEYLALWKTNILISNLYALHVLLNGCDTCALNSNLRKLIDAFGTVCLHKIVGCCWPNTLQTEELFFETGSKAYDLQGLSVSMPLPAVLVCGTPPKGQPHSPSCLCGKLMGHSQIPWPEQVSRPCNDAITMGMGHAGRLPQRSPWVCC